MFDENRLNKDELKPGDRVYICQGTMIGWGYFRYPRYTPEVIKRITPKRTKFVMESGKEFGRDTVFYKLTDKERHTNHVAVSAKKLSHFLFEAGQVGDWYKRMTDEEIVEAADLMEKVYALMRKKE